ncbi:hypothetical protein XA26_00450 [Mycolicibacterium fortuitum]|uniref:Uncharacterized protein n=1 Tax=Mycolicibacterium fortuitum TaxID=1766 RepID=A0A0N7H7N4_MYCFO|nr:hypothetical protein G155_00205 [Mycobacterium sp. VKM Ac-1817D]ALI23911.1 hypothetical protein XA26_00450 [Mycolicibacterium fortuitum]
MHVPAARRALTAAETAADDADEIGPCVRRTAVSTPSTTPVAAVRLVAAASCLADSSCK